MATRVLMRAASGPEIGLGHAVRTLAVAEALVALGHAPCLIVDDAASAEFLGPLARVADDSPGWIEEEWSVAWFDAFADVSEPLEALARRGIPCALVENRTPARELASVVIYPSLHHRNDEWDMRHETCSGAAWIPLRTLVRDVPRLPPENRDVDLLVTFGGSDPLHSTERILGQLDPANGERIVVALGPHMLDRRRGLEALRSDVEFQAPGRDLPSWMARSRRAVTALATTLNELAFFGVGASVLANYASDAPVLAHYAEHGPHTSLGVTGDVDDATLAQRLREARTAPVPAPLANLGRGSRALAELLLQLPTRS